MQTKNEEETIIQSTVLGHYQGFVKSFLGRSTVRWAILQLLCSQARRKLKEKLLNKRAMALYTSEQWGNEEWAREAEDEVPGGL